MKILHITAHLGGGVGTVIMDWMDKTRNDFVICLDSVNEKARNRLKGKHAQVSPMDHKLISLYMDNADIVLVHYWDHPLLKELFYRPTPPCRMVFWLHKNSYDAMTLPFPPEWFIKTSPVQGDGRYIWSTGDISRFLEIKPKPHEGFNIGYVGTVDYKKIHPDTFQMCRQILDRIPEAHFTFIGDVSQEILLGMFQPPPLPPSPLSSYHFTFTGKVDDVAPYLAEMDVFGYPLRPDHYGTCEQVLGEAMAAGVVPVVLNNGCERSIVEDGVSGFIGHTIQHYIDHFNYLSNNHRRFSKSCRERAKNLYSIDTMISQWNAVFEEMMSQPKQERKPL